MIRERGCRARPFSAKSTAKGKPGGSSSGTSPGAPRALHLTAAFATRGELSVHQGNVNKGTLYMFYVWWFVKSSQSGFLQGFGPCFQSQRQIHPAAAITQLLTVYLCPSIAPGRCENENPCIQCSVEMKTKYFMLLWVSAVHLLYPESSGTLQTSPRVGF